MMRHFWLYCIYLAFLVLAISVWSGWFAPRLTKIPDNFYYNADILSLDNFYDELSNKFEGAHISKTVFNYTVKNKAPNYLEIDNLIDVRKIDNSPIFSVVRKYFINPLTGEHVTIPNAEKRNGYLFAPKFSNRKSFNYWHVNYDEPAPLQYVNTETLNGLSVDHYKAHYSADQSNNLTYLPGVPDKRGVKVDINLDTWFEPISGWLVQYQDNSLASFYDRVSGATLTPWNHFSNQYTQNSANQQIEYAKYLKWKILFVYIGVPILFTLIFLFVIATDYIKYKNPSIMLWVDKNIFIRMKKINLFNFVTLVLVVFIVSSNYYIYSNQKSPTIYKIGISRWNDNPLLYEAVQGFKDGLEEYGYKEGKNVSFIIKNPDSNIENQINIIQYFLKENVDLIYTLTTPGTLVAKGIVKNTPVVFSDVTYPVESSILPEPGNENSNFVGSRNYIIPAEQYYDFDKLFPTSRTIGFVHHKGESDSTILMHEYEVMLKKRGVTVVDIAAIDLDDLRLQLQKPINYDALFLACDTLLEGGGSKIVADFSRNNKIPSFSCDKESVLNGALVGYVADLYIIGKIAGIKAALILRGAEPSWLQTVSPERGYLIINLITAKLLGITVPPEMLKSADFIIK